MTTNANIGADINCASGLDPLFTLVSGRTALGQAIARRLQTPRGTLAWIGDTADYGYDVRQHLNDDAPDVAAIAAAVTDELSKDERVEGVRASVAFDELAGTLRITATGYASTTGPFALVLSIEAVTVAILDAETTT